MQARRAISAGDKVAVRWTTTGTHEGDQLGMPATHRKVKLTGIDMMRIACAAIVLTRPICKGIDLHAGASFRKRPRPLASARGGLKHASGLLSSTFSRRRGGDARSFMAGVCRARQAATLGLPCRRTSTQRVLGRHGSPEQRRARYRAGNVASNQVKPSTTIEQNKVKPLAASGWGPDTD